MKVAYIIISSALFLFSSCDSGKLKEPVQSVNDVCYESVPTFKNDVWPIFESNCLHCHGVSNYARKADGNLFSGYDDVKSKLDEGLIIGNIEHKQGFINMPYRKKKITACEIEVIKAWVAAGAIDN